MLRAFHPLAFAAAISAACLCQSNAQIPQKQLPLKGETFLVENRVAFLIPPTGNLSPGRVPWVLYAPTLSGLPSASEKWMFEKFLAAGIAVAGIDVGESYGSPEGRRLFSSLYRELSEKKGFSAKTVLLARSRGGLMTLCWAAENADKIAAFAGIYPVCNIASYPGVSKAAGAYLMTPGELSSNLEKHNPIDRLASLAAAKVPFFSIHGDVDRTVPLESNSGELQKRYEALGGSMELIVPKGQGHNMWEGFFQCEELVAFVLKHAR
jgi:pimeloyl-ACP methyl ester carboxylesterase